MRKGYEKNYYDFIDYLLVKQSWTGYYMGELPLQLEELGIELGQQFDDLEQLSIQLEEQPIQSLFQYWGLR
jgi:hypothetical protein